jgi:eukaryotic-like serine/threonine-protein kinase
MLGDSVRRRQPGKRPAANGRRFRWKTVLIALPIALVVPFLIGYLIATRVMFPPPQDTGTGIAVPDLIGRSAAEAQQALVAAGLGELQPMDLPHPSAPAGQVVAQSPLPGQQLRTGAAVQVALSGGRPRALVPDILGFSAERAEVTLRRSGFAIERIPEESPAAPGRVVRTDPAPGEERTLPATVTVFVSTGPPAEEPDTLAPPDVPPPDA